MKNNKTVLQNLNIVNTIRKFDKWGCGCDYLRLCYKNESDFVEDSINLVDSDNSNFFTREIGGILFTIKKGYCNLGTVLDFSCSYNDVSVPVAQFVKYDSHNSYLFKSYGKFDFYGAIFRLIDIGFFDRSIILLLKVLISEENPKVTRFDYRLDFFSMKKIKIPVPEQFLLYIHTQSVVREHRSLGSTGEYQSWDLGMNKGKNNRYALRYYDKLEDCDSVSKNKIFLYQDYFMYNTVHRFEIEFQPNFLKGYTFYDFYDGLIQDKIESILGLTEKMFSGPLFYQYESDYTIQDKDKSKYLRRYSTESVRLAKNKINPLIQCYKALFYELEDSELQKNMSDFLDFIGQDKFQYKLRYEKMKDIFIQLHKI